MTNLSFSSCTTCNNEAHKSVTTLLETSRERSQIINALRLPMAAGVVFIHNNWVVEGIKSHVDSGEWGMLGIIHTSVPNFFAMAVPLFFLISGYLFFLNFDTWSWRQYGDKLKRRVHSLLIPYIIWNIFAIIGEIQNTYRSGSSVFAYFNGFTPLGILRLFWCSGTYASTNTNWLGIPHLTDYPADIPLWFVRDLMVLVLLAPAVFFLIRKMHFWWLALLFPVFVLGLCPTLFPGFSISSLFFFSAGAFFALEKRDFVKFSMVAFRWTSVLSVALLCGIIVGEKANWAFKEFLNPMYVLCSVPATIAVGVWLYRKGCLAWSICFAPSSFFIYAAHFVSYIGLLGISRCCLLIVFGEPATEWGATILYLVNPLLAIILCVACHRLLMRFFPRTTAVLCGGRG